MLTLNTKDFQLQVKPITIRHEAPGGPYHEWIDMLVTVTVPGIKAEGQCSVMPNELRQFLQQLQSMNSQLRPGQTAELSSTERGFKLFIQLLNNGAILGNYFFQPFPPDGACLTGQCGFDQTWLDELIGGVESLLP